MIFVIFITAFIGGILGYWIGRTRVFYGAVEPSQPPRYIFPARDLKPHFPHNEK